MPVPELAWLQREMRWMPRHIWTRQARPLRLTMFQHDRNGCKAPAASSLSRRLEERNGMNSRGRRNAPVAVGTLSLIMWPLPMTTSLKYVAIVMLAGIQRGERAEIAIAILGAALLDDDGATTPWKGLVPILAAAGLRALRLAAVDGRSRRRVYPPTARAYRPSVRPDHDALVRQYLGLIGVVRHRAVLAAFDPRWPSAFTRYGLVLPTLSARPRWWSMAKSQEANPFSGCAPALGLAQAISPPHWASRPLTTLLTSLLMFAMRKVSACSVYIRDRAPKSHARRAQVAGPVPCWRSPEFRASRHKR
jgi:hypothetical protein